MKKEKDGIKNTLKAVHDTYRDRCDDPSRQKKAWRKIIAPAFSPALDIRPEDRPGLLLSREAGDLGCALLWIVQAALVQPCLRRIRQQPGLSPEQKDLLAAISDDQCGALAHSEPRDAPVIMTAGDKTGCLLNGVKKYITGGYQADFILLTARAPDEKKTSRLLLLPVSVIDFSKEMTPLDLKSLCTISHGRLTLKDKTIPAHYRMPLSPSQVRKALKVNSLVERCLIMEAVLGCLIYVNGRLKRQTGDYPTDKDTLNKLLVEQTSYTTATIGEARAGNKVQMQWVDLNDVNTAIGAILDAAENVEGVPDDNPDNDLMARVNDLRFIRSLWGD